MDRGKDIGTPGREKFTYWDLVRLLLEIWWYVPDMYTDEFHDVALYIHMMLGCGSNFSAMKMAIFDTNFKSRQSTVKCCAFYVLYNIQNDH